MLTSPGSNSIMADIACPCMQLELMLQQDNVPGLKTTSIHMTCMGALQ